MDLHVFAATSGNFWEAPRAAIAVKKNVPLEWMELSQLSLYMALGLYYASYDDFHPDILARMYT